MTNFIDMTPEQVREMSTDDLVEAIAQKLYDQAQYARNRADQSDQAGNSESVQLWERECQAFCAAAEHVRDVLRN